MELAQPNQDSQHENADQSAKPEGSGEASNAQINSLDSPERTVEQTLDEQDAVQDKQNADKLLKVNTDRSSDSEAKRGMSTKGPTEENSKQMPDDQAGESPELLSSAKLKGKRPNLTIIKFADGPEGYKDQFDDTSPQRQEDSPVRQSVTLVNQESSPLSPHKKRNLVAPNDTSARVDESFEMNSFQRTHTNQSQKEVFNGFKIKDTVDINTTGFGAEVSPKPFEINIDPVIGDKQKEYIPANPILPKTQHPEQKQPPQCPLNDIKFIQLQKFKKFKDQPLAKMSDGYDQMGKKNMMRENRLKKQKFEEDQKDKRIRKGQEDDETEAKMDEYTHIIQNIVFARDPKIFDTKNGFVNQRNAFMHENMLNIKQLIRANEERNGGNERFGAPRSPPPRRVLKTKQQMDYELALEAKARYRLKRDEETNIIDRSDKTLLFESRFESGNLYLAQKVSDHEYNLLMQNDINTSGHTQWFYFQVKNTRKNMSVTFNIMNFTKPDSLFNYGMKVSIYSEKKANGVDPNAQNKPPETVPLQENTPSAEGQQEGKDKPPAPGESNNGCGWFKGGERISYYVNGIKKDITYTSRGYFTASFTYKFTHDDDTVYFAYCCPYSYTDCMQDIYEIEADPERRKMVSRKTLCKTLAGVDCDILTITEKGNFEAMQKKKAVVISARVHPGETVASWMMRGVINYLTDPENKEAQMLRDRYIFKIIPMLNPDGVINGNYRCSLAGCDLNRRWKAPHKQLHPTIFYTKKLITEIHKERGLVLYCDLHGHSRKQNVFMYGCNNLKNPAECRVFPLILSKLSQFFHFGSCRFGVQKSKETTARVSVYKDLKNCPNIFTMESTFAGLDFGDRKGQHMTTSDFEQMGADLCRTLLIYENIYVPPELEHLYGNKPDGEKADMSSFFENELANNKKLLAAGDGDSSGGSESEPSEDNLPVNEIAAVVPIVDKKDQVKLQKIMKKKAQDEKDLEKAKANRKRGEDSPTRSPKPGQRSPIKPSDQPVIKVKPVEEKKEEKKKPEMKDACTQTERSDYQRIKKQQQQARMMQEMKEQQARMRGQQQYKSPGSLVSGQMRKSPQSQTAQRELSGQYNVSPNKKKLDGYDTQERHLKDMRDPKQYQLSKDKYSLFQVQNFNPAHQTAPPQQAEMQSPKVNQQIDQARGSHQPGGNQLNFQQKAGMNIMVNSNSGGKQGSNPIIFQNPQNKNMVIQMSQLNSGIVSNGYNNGDPRQQNRTSNRQGPPPQLQQQQQPPKNQQRFKSKNEENELHNPTQQNLRAPGSTISKAGEQIMQKTSKFQSPKKSSNTNQSLQNSGNVSKNNHELRFQQQGITSNHFGAIHMGGNMSFVKDGFLKQKNKNIDPASMSAPYKVIDPASMSAPSSYALRSGGTNSGQNSIHSHNRNNTNFNPQAIAAGHLGGPHARSEQQSLQQQSINLQYNQYGGSQPNHRSGTGSSKGDPTGASTGFNNKIISNRVPSDTFKSYNNSLPQVPVSNSNPNSASPSTIKEQNEINRRGSIQRRAQNNSQIEQVNSRNYTQMDNIQLFKSPQNSKSVVGAGGGVINIPNQNSNLQGSPNIVPQGPAQLHISAINPNVTKSFDKRDAQMIRQGHSPIGIQNRADSIHDNNLTHKNEGQHQAQRTLIFNPAGQTMQPTTQHSIPSTPRKKGDRVGVKNSGQLSAQMQNSIGSSGTINTKYISFNPAAQSNTQIVGFTNSAIRNAESSIQRQMQMQIAGSNVQRGSHLESQSGQDSHNLKNNLTAEKGRSRVNSLLSSDPNQLTSIKIMPGGGPQNVMQTQKMGVNNHQMQLQNTPGGKRQSQASINSGNFIIQSQQQQYQASLAADQMQSPSGSPNKRPQNGHTQSNNIHNNRNVYRMKINQKSDIKINDGTNQIDNGESSADK